MAAVSGRIKYFVIFFRLGRSGCKQCVTLDICRNNFLSATINTKKISVGTTCISCSWRRAPFHTRYTNRLNARNKREYETSHYRMSAECSREKVASDKLQLISLALQ